MIQPTSRQAYDSIRDSLGDRQKKVLSMLDMSQGLTNRELAHLLNWPINTVTPRVNELVRHGLVQEDCKRKCSLGGRMSIAWKVVPAHDIMAQIDRGTRQIKWRFG